VKVRVAANQNVLSDRRLTAFSAAGLTHLYDLCDALRSTDKSPLKTFLSRVSILTRY